MTAIRIVSTAIRKAIVTLPRKPVVRKSGQQVIPAGPSIWSGGEAVAFRDDGFHICLCVGWRACVRDVALNIEEVRFRAFRVDDAIGHQEDF